MANGLTIVEEHHFLSQGKNCVEIHVVSSTGDKSIARDMLADAFENRWREHVFPEDLWLLECHAPEDSSDGAWFVSKFPDEGMYKFYIKEE